MAYQFGSFPAVSTGFATSLPNFGASYGFNSGFASAPVVSSPSPFASSFGAVSAPTVFSPGYSTAGFGAAPVFSGASLGATTLGGFGGLYSAGVTAPTAYNTIPSGFAAPTAFGTQFGQFGQFTGFQTPDGLAQNAFLAQAQQNVDGARGRQVSKITQGLGVPTMIPMDGNEEKLERTPSGNLPRREASRGELRTRSFSGQGVQPVQNAPNSMAAYLSQNSSLGASRAQAVAASTMSPRNLGAPTGHRGSNPREQVPW